MKAILVIDMSDNCTECHLVEYCTKKQSRKIFPFKKSKIGRAFSCPLKPMPQKKGISLKEAIGVVCSCYSDGWNDCIDEILGAENEI